MKNKIIANVKYRPEIVGIKAFAIVTIIINHFNENILPGGYLGVDIFFVISGFVLISSFFDIPKKKFIDFISGFYENRLKRLLLPLSVCVLFTSIILCFFTLNPRLSIKTGISSLFGLSNLYLLK